MTQTLGLTGKFDSGAVMCRMRHVINVQESKGEMAVTAALLASNSHRCFLAIRT